MRSKQARREIRQLKAENEELRNELERAWLIVGVEQSTVGYLQRRLEKADPTFKVVGRAA